MAGSSLTMLPDRPRRANRARTRPENDMHHADGMNSRKKEYKYVMI